jgi:hypothetical protein
MTEKKPDPAKSDTGKPIVGAEAARATPPAPATGTASKRDIVPVLYVLGFAILAGAIIWLWDNPPVAAPPPPSPEIATLRQQVGALQERIARLESKPAPTIPAPPDPAPLTARIAALEARKPPAPVDLGPLEAAVAALEQRPVGDPALTARVDAMASRQEALDGRMSAADTAIVSRQGAVEAQLGSLQKSAGQITALADRSARIARVQAAQAALDSGTKLGDIPGAPPALARYAAAAPPTEASLRLAFPAVAAAAMAASKPSLDGQPFLDRAWARAQELVTLRKGDEVLVGDPAAGVLARARAALDAGDLAGAVKALGALGGASAAAVADWKSQAQGLLDARKVLADMAAHA